jgi:signal transduction histidine kinase
MERGELLSTRQRHRLLSALERASETMNKVGNEALGAVLDRLRVFELNADVLRSNFERIRREPAFSSMKIADMQLEIHAPLSTWIPVPGYAVEDILSNLFRNAIQASAGSAEGPIRLGMSLRLETDEITGVERIALGVRDNAAGSLSVEDIRAQSVERGLGLTAQRVAQFEGTIDVRSKIDGWTKEVVVKFYRTQARSEEEVGA